MPQNTQPGFSENHLLKSPVAVFMKGKYRTRQPIRQLMLK
jgi:hypothetical protein